MPPGPNKNVVSGFCEKEPPTVKQIIGKIVWAPTEFGRS